MSWRRGSERDRGSSLSSHRLMGEDFERSRKARVWSARTQVKLVHNEARDRKTSLQVRHTWLNAIKSRELISVGKKPGMRARISGGIRLIGERPFRQNRIRRRTSEASRSRISI